MCSSSRVRSRLTVATGLRVRISRTSSTLKKTMMGISDKDTRKTVPGRPVARNVPLLEKNSRAMSSRACMTKSGGGLKSSMTMNPRTT